MTIPPTILRLKITEIEWDFDNEDNEASGEVNLWLPSVPFYIDVDSDGHDMDNLPVADTISDEYGWCVKNCDYEIIK